VIPEWKTIVINRGKRDKLSKKDVVGFLFQKGGLDKEDLGIVEIKESCAFAAVKREKVKGVLARIRDEKIKNMRAKFV
ncbi:MAG: DbpA RNA binding domain-containing protein, partial [Parabacteroides sp.]|nr:DbpA RNA binding domain-containing protein [Parabacteroides sp.]